MFIISNIIIFLNKNQSIGTIRLRRNEGNYDKLYRTFIEKYKI